ncbi:hypothetical protein ACVIRO_006064 [Rhizobium ruizarguesonis]|jgi:hypothetical protein
MGAYGVRGEAWNLTSRIAKPIHDKAMPVLLLTNEETFGCEHPGRWRRNSPVRFRTTN